MGPTWMRDIHYHICQCIVNLLHRCYKTWRCSHVCRSVSTLQVHVVKQYKVQKMNKVVVKVHQIEVRGWGVWKWYTQKKHKQKHWNTCWIKLHLWSLYGMFLLAFDKLVFLIETGVNCLCTRTWIFNMPLK